ncbi:hypothetical protein [Streptomyces sp. NPDC088146]|uniref:hypothetical protein n=1 Tax=Streptomyces sp. NPDC088146 TaxID=3365829 RepID=UPI0038028140
MALMTWLPLVIEGSLAVSLLLPQRLRWWTPGAGLLFHLLIALMMGLWSFALAMAGGILVLCLPLGSTIRLHADENTATTEMAHPQEAKALDPDRSAPPVEQPQPSR